MVDETLAASPGRATLSRIARDASVSMSTVSKVLNGRTGVSPETRSRVEELLFEHGYNRRGVEHTQGSLIELVFENIDSVWSLEIIRGVERVARQNGMSVALTETGDRHTPGQSWIDGVMQRKPLAVILVFSDLSADHKRQLLTRNIPFVVVDPAGDPAPDVPSIGSTNWSGGLAATRHLLELGHRRIAVISGPDDLMCSRARVSGYRSALEEAGIPIDPELVAGGDFHPEDGRREALRLLALPDRPTAIFAGNDMQAFGVYEAARSLGLSIPEDLSVVGYDDVPPARWVGPPLTTIRQPLIEMAEEATRLALRLRTEHVDNLRLDLATSLVVRGSTAAPR
jgi:LacI family xylobiose transport system transcriptional regulator